MKKTLIIIALIVGVLIILFLVANAIFEYRLKSGKFFTEVPDIPKSDKTNPPVNIVFSMSVDTINVQLNNGFLNWNKLQIGKLQVSKGGVDSRQEYFIPESFGCLDGIDDKPLYLIYETDSGSKFKGGNAVLMPGQSGTSEYRIFISASGEYLNAFMQYPNMWSNYPQKDYSQKGFEIGNQNSLKLRIYSIKNIADLPHCLNIDEYKFNKVGEILLSQ